MPLNFHIEPRDVLFLRDARPMEASDAGLGANWPRPDQIWSAFINAFHRRWPELQEWEHKHNRTSAEENSPCSFRFGGLKTAGPFPCAIETGRGQDGVLLFEKGFYLPCPLDLSVADDGSLLTMRLVDAGGTDLPKPLTKAFQAETIGKQTPPQWLHESDYRRYLAGDSFKPAVREPELYSPERNIGIGIDPESGSAAKGKFYQAEYLRFNPEVRMAVQAECGNIGENRRETDVFAQIADEENIPFILGGQQGVALLNRVATLEWLPSSAINMKSETLLLRWTLLAPAVYPAIAANGEKGVKEHPGGWLPNWIDPISGQVCLPRESVERGNGESRDAWRMRVARAQRFSSRLVAARIGKPVAFSGWDLQTGPKPTQLAVPAGSVYVFECPDRSELEELAAALSWNGGNGNMVQNRRSTIFGEKGYGLGVCSALCQ